MEKILVINGPNLNLLGEREPGIYGRKGYAELSDRIMDKADELGVKCEIFQSNHEGAIVDKLHAARKSADGIVINAGAYTHYSYAIRDAIAAIKIPVIEVHISNVFARDEFRSKSVIGSVCRGSISGFGFGSYFMAMDALVKYSEE
ncbi:MAG: type II 3-dehydroquinate dehydratase [Clostridium sp.]|nr:type II 3-dehydroquinate dehydratase [Clostridium sp.]MCM1547245.1 type II 3-dehydroquinate dehydratase [Ruminococcus sp.]